MKFLDKVRIINDCEYFNKYGIFKGRIGTINEPFIRDNSFEVVFIDERFFNKDFHWTDENMETMEDDIFLDIQIKDMEVIKESNLTDEEIFEGVNAPYDDLWFKVENGYIMNLLGEKKNKIPYDYNS